MRLLAVVCAGVSARVATAATDARNCRREISALVITSPNFQDAEALEPIAIPLYCQHRINRRINWRAYLWTGWTLAILVVGFAKEYYMDGATVLIVALAVGFVLVVMFFVLEARKHAGKWMDSDN